VNRAVRRVGRWISGFFSFSVPPSDDAAVYAMNRKWKKHPVSEESAEDRTTRNAGWRREIERWG
jgi:hypothetical protein